MLESVSGKITLPETGIAVVQTGGVAFRLFVSAATAEKLVSVAEGTVYTYLNVKEDALELFGFFDTAERRCFLQLITVSGVGPKAALSILSVLTPDTLASAVAGGNVKAITAANGVGTKLAQRIVLELKEKMGGISAASDLPVGKVTSSQAEAVEALVVLGYSASLAQEAVAACPAAGVEETIRLALRYLSQK